MGYYIHVQISKWRDDNNFKCFLSLKCFQLPIFFVLTPSLKFLMEHCNFFSVLGIIWSIFLSFYWVNLSLSLFILKIFHLKRVKREGKLLKIKSQIWYSGIFGLTLGVSKMVSNAPIVTKENCVLLNGHPLSLNCLKLISNSFRCSFFFKLIIFCSKIFLLLS